MELDRDMVLGRIFEGAEAPPEPTRPVPPTMTVPSTEASTPRPYPGHGAFLAPPRSVGRLPPTSIVARIYEYDDVPGRLVHEARLGGHDLVATHTGYVGLKTSDKTEARRWLNLLAAAFCQAGVTTYVVREQDIGGFHTPRDASEAMWGGEWPGAPPRGEHSFTLNDHWFSIDEFNACLRRAGEFATRPYAGEIPLLLEAATHVWNGQATPSILFSWALIERAIGARWDAFIRQRAIAGRRKDKLNDTMLWTLDATAEALEFDGSLSRQEYDALQPVKKARNQVFHGDRMATYEEAEAALRVAEQLLLRDDPVILAPGRPTRLDRWVEARPPL